MSVYPLEYINNIINNTNILDNKLPSNIQYYLDSIINDINNGKYMLTPNFIVTTNRNNKYKKNNSKQFSNKNKRDDGQSIKHKYNEKNINKGEFTKNKSEYNNSYDNTKNNKTDYNNITNNSSNNSNYNNNKILSDNRIYKIKEKNNRTELEHAEITIKKILNKITHKTYDKLHNELICYYKSLIEEFSNENIICINEYIFNNIVYFNHSYSDIYCHFFIKLLSINDLFKINIDDASDKFEIIYQFITIPKSFKYDDICNANKENDKYKSLSYFILNCLKKNVINISVIFNALNNLYDELIIKLSIENNKIYCEEICEFIYLIISNIHNNIIISKDIITINNYNTYYNKCLIISNFNNKEFLSITNKIIFKHKDIIDKFPLS